MLLNHIKIFSVSSRTFSTADLSKLLNSESLLSELNLSKCFQCLRSTNYPLVMSTKGNHQDNAKYAAVLIPLCVDSKGNLSILYTRRSGNLRRHTRQISFPGGLRDNTDTSYEDTALRETEEEIGLRKRRIKILGHASLIRPPNTAAIMPIVGLIKNLNLKKELKINEDEVDEAFTIDIKDLISPDSKRHTQFKSGYSSPTFVVDNYRIWGITGFLTNLFLNCLLPNECHYDAKVGFVKPFRPAVKKSDF
ncbi:NUDT8 family protein [Megaselia abdita]